MYAVPDAVAWKKSFECTDPAPCGKHAVQFYGSDSFLAARVAFFLGEGLGRGEAAILVARPNHAIEIQRQLEADGFDLVALSATGQFCALDAQATLERFMQDGMPDWNRFEEIIGGMIRQRQQSFERVRAYGEMVDILRAEGDISGMLRLEEHWNDLADTLTFSLLCGYGMESFTGEEQAAAFEDVCRAHDQVSPTEAFIALGNDRERSLAVARLQRRAASLEAEVDLRKATESALRASEASLRDALRARDEFLSIASHELKTPITSLKLQTQMVGRRLERNDPSLLGRPQLTKLVHTSNRQIERLDRLVDDMLDISRISRGQLRIEPESLDLGELVRDVVDRFAAEMKAAGCRHRLTVESAIVGSWDRYRLEQLLANLISNAFKYAAGKPIEISVTSAGDVASIQVRDQGPGIAPQNLERIFHRFERGIGSENLSGLGLGLYIGHQIVAAHGGRIWAESEEGAGATFLIELPIVS